tara:strand:+ start:1580 stop:1801 length:222 start_codon:yes stop_codon:yes gene_type:complete
MSFLMPKMPSPPAMVMPEVKDVPNYDDADRKKAEREALELSEAKRRGRKSTILTTGTGLTTEAELNQKSLLGG